VNADDFREFVLLLPVAALLVVALYAFALLVFAVLGPVA
jgi:hypothetical protein